MSARYRRRAKLKFFYKDLDEVPQWRIFKNPCYKCVLPKCHIYADEEKDQDCYRHLMSVGCSWVCPYFVRGWCAYTSTKNQCALDVRDIDKTEHYPLLVKLQQSLLNYYKEVALRTDKGSGYVSLKPGKGANVSTPIAPKAAQVYLKLLLQIKEAVPLESVCNYALACADPVITPTLVGTDQKVLELYRKYGLPSRKLFHYIWNGGIESHKLHGTQKIRSDLPPLSPDSVTFSEFIARIKQE